MSAQGIGRIRRAGMWACGIVLVGGAWAEAATKAEKTKAAEQLVREALGREVFGQQAERDRLLRDANEQAPDYAPAKWHQGRVRHQNQWLSADDAAAAARQDRRLELYEKQREKLRSQPDAQLQLANWCRDKGLREQERAHLTRVLDATPDHAEARARLGFKQINGAWVTPDEVERQNQRTQAEAEALAKWKPQLEKLCDQLRQRSEQKRSAARTRLTEISDPAAIPAIEATLTTENEEMALLAVEIVGKMTASEATQSLIRHAVYSAFDPVREAAARQLRERSHDAFVPPLLASLNTPVTSRLLLSSTPNGRIVFRHAFGRETQNEQHLLVLDTEYRRVARPGGSRNDTAERALEDAQLLARRRELALTQQNARTQQTNDRIFAALATATRQALPAEPQSWWNWWNEANEVFVKDEKQLKAVRRVEQVAIVDRVSEPNVPSPQSSSGPTLSAQGQRSLAMDCLAAGTPVWTLHGKVAVEKIQVGDLVLSQHPETGELAYKPVLQTTVRPKGPLMKVVAGRDTIETSGGHLFWVSGEGWVKSRKLTSGKELHTTAGTVRVDYVEESPAAETYNLVVADFNTYFVGDERTLCHDNTVRQPTTAVVPGLKE